MAKETKAIDEIDVLEKKIEDLLARAVDEGADVNYALIRLEMDVRRSNGFPGPDPTSQGHLEERIAAAKREQAKRASHRSLTFRFKNLIGLSQY